MIISRIDGGLGNQMFQYAYGLYLAKKHGSDLMLDTRTYALQPQHGYLLDHFQVNAKKIDKAELPYIPRRYRDAKRNTLKESIRCVVQGKSLRRHKESTFGFHAKHLRVADNRYLVGYWQSERFFPGMRAELLQQFKLRDPLTPASQQIAERIRSTNSLAVHVRRGDYVANASAAQIYTHLSSDYYLQAIQRWAATQEQPEVFVFSNDIAWCREQFDLPWPITFVDHNNAATAHEDMALMSLAKCCVIANSTFSWWAAWLNERKEKVVFAPSQWFNRGTLDGSNIIPVHWRVCEYHATKQAA